MSKEHTYKTAYILFFATINGNSTESLMTTLTSDLPDNIDTLYIILSTNGGSVSHGVAIYNLLKALPYKIITHNCANIDSIGNTVFMAGEERYTCSNARFLLHAVKTNTQDIPKMAGTDLVEKLTGVTVDQERISTILIEHTHLTKNELDEFFKQGETKDVDYALSKGMVHAVKELSIPRDTCVRVIKSSSSDQ